MSKRPLHRIALLSLCALVGCGSLEDVDAPVRQSVFLANGDLAAFSARELRLFDGRLERERGRVAFGDGAADPHDPLPTFHAVSADGQIAASAWRTNLDTLEYRVEVRHLQGGRRLFTEVVDGIMHFSLSPDGTLLAISTGRSRTLTVRRTDGESAWTFDGDIGAMVFSPDSAVLYAGVHRPEGGELAAWDARTGALRYARSQVIGSYSLSVSPDGVRLLAQTRGPDGAIVYGFFRAVDGELHSTFPQPPELNFVAGSAMAPAGGLWASTSLNHLAPAPSPGTHRLLMLLVRAADGSILHRREVSESRITFSPDGATIAVTIDGAVWVLAARDGAVIATRKVTDSVL